MPFGLFQQTLLKPLLGLPPGSANLEGGQGGQHQDVLAGRGQTRIGQGRDGRGKPAGMPAPGTLEIGVMVEVLEEKGLVGVR